MRWRAIVGALALYAVLLQGFLAAATPALPFGGQGILCTEHGPGQPDRGGLPAGHEHQCCVPGHASPLAPPPGAFRPVAWTRPASAPAIWRPEADLPRTRPPIRAQSPRGPPLA